MQNNILDTLGINLDKVPKLDSRARSRLLNYLLRWDHVDTLHTCLDILIPRNPNLVSLLDLRARAYLAQEAYAEALAVMRTRLQMRSSITAQALLARIHMKRGNLKEAQAIAEHMTQEKSDSIIAWALSGDVALARADIEAAQIAYREVRRLRPYSRTYLLGMLAIYQARGDLVSASGYAVRLLRTAEEIGSLPTSYLHRLRDYFQASGEATRVQEIDGTLARRAEREREDLRSYLSTDRGARRPRKRARRKAVPKPKPAKPQITLDQISVSNEERQRITEATQRLFGFETFLPGQVEAIACVLRGEDVLTILPTGGGKSLCYQLPAMLNNNGTTLVISPLIALMKDQVDSLPPPVRQHATTINSSLEWDELQRRMQDAAAGKYRLIYAAPERLRQPAFLHALNCVGIHRLVIDEAHCVSVWGHDFRPDYLYLGESRKMMGNPPLLALTATAPPRVRRDIMQHLGNMRLVAGDVTRPNLQLEVFYAHDTDDKLQRLIAFCKAEAGSGIVYAGTRARCEELAALLRKFGINAAHYHAGIRDRARVQDEFMMGRTRVVVATVAFGMGIDKADIRFIVHFVPPPSLEAYYQEAGRAGRDGLPSRCLLMYSSSDRGTLTRRAHEDVMPVSFLRSIYGAVRHRLNGAPQGQIAPEDLERDVQAKEVQVRVALRLLEECALLRRGPDLPRATLVRIPDVTADTLAQEDADLATFCAAARLRPGQWLTVDLMAVAEQAQLSLKHIEQRLLTWVDAGWMECRFSGRDMLLELLKPPADATERVATMLERYETVQGQRVDEITAYAKTEYCRHGHLNAYLGGRQIQHCDACDNCIDITPPPEIDLPNEKAQLLTILHCMAATKWSWGRRNLGYILRGTPKAPESARHLEEFGALAFRSNTAIGKLLDQLKRYGLLQTRKLDHGGAVLELTQPGREALNNPAILELIEQH